MRCFIGIDLSEKVKDEIVNIQNKLPEINMKKIRKENLHITLKFLGGVPKQEIGKVKRILGELDFSKFKLEISKLGVFNPSFIRIIWLGFKNSGKLKELNMKIGNILEGFGDSGEFSGHITIGRVKSLGKLERKEVLDKLKKIEVGSIGFEVNKIKLKESVLSKEGPEYKDLFVKSLG